MYFSWKVDVCWSLDWASQGEIPSQGNCVMFLVKTFHYFTEPLSAQVYKWAMVNPEWTKRLIREVGGAEIKIPLVTSNCANKRPPNGLYLTQLFLILCQYNYMYNYYKYFSTAQNHVMKYLNIRYWNMMYCSSYVWSVKISLKFWMFEQCC